MEYFSYLIGHEGEGSLYSVLKEEGLAESVTGMVDHEMRIMSMMVIDVNLTEKGYNE